MDYLTIIIPVYNNSATITQLFNKIKKNLNQCKINKYTICFVNDASSDDSEKKIKNLINKNKKIKLINLTNNSGQRNAISAGLANTKSKFYLMIAADLQDDPSVIKIFANEFKKKNTHIVLLKRNKLVGGIATRITSFIHYMLIRMVVQKYPRTGIDVYGFSQKVKLTLYENIMNGPIALELFRSNFDKTIIGYNKLFDFNRKSGHTFIKRIDLHFNQILSISKQPNLFLWIITIIFMFIFIFYSGFLIIDYFLFNKETKIQGWKSIFIFNVFSSSLILINLGLITEYVRRIFKQTQKIPNFKVKEIFERK